MSAFALPSLDGVPRTYTLPAAGRNMARIALGILDAGLIPPDVSRPLAGDPVNLVQTGLKRWLDQQSAGMRHIGFEASLHDFSHVRRDGALSEVHLYISTGFPPWITIGPRLTAMQRAITGLGTTVLYWLGEAADAAVPFVFPANVEQMASWIYWQGMDDESDMLAQMKAEGDNPDDASIVTRAQFDRYIPKWACLHKPMVGIEGLKALANPRRTRITGRAARATVALIDALARHRKAAAAAKVDSENTLNEQIWPPCAVLTFSRKGPEERIVDDYAHDLSQSGEHREHFAKFTALNTDAELGTRIAAFLRSIEPVFAILRAVDALIDVIAEPRRA